MAWASRWIVLIRSFYVTENLPERLDVLNVYVRVLIRYNPHHGFYLPPLRNSQADIHNNFHR